MLGRICEHDGGHRTMVNSRGTSGQKLRTNGPLPVATGRQRGRRADEDAIGVDNHRNVDRLWPANYATIIWFAAMPMTTIRLERAAVLTHELLKLLKGHSPVGVCGGGDSEAGGDNTLTH